MRCAAGFWEHRTARNVVSGLPEAMRERRRLLHAVPHQEKGAVMTEAALAMPLFFVLLIVAIDLSLIAYAGLSLQFVSTTVAREASIGTMTNEDIADRAVALASRFFVRVDRDTGVRMCPAALYRTCGNLASGRFTQAPTRQLFATRIESVISGIVIGRVYSSLTRQNLVVDKTVVMRREPDAS